METPVLLRHRHFTDAWVLTVPMRNGNLFISFTKFESVSVLTVPMRNGNWWLRLLASLGQVKFLPYLWGMETWECGWCHAPIFKFLPYLWGMETASLQQHRIASYSSSYRTYEEWKPRKNKKATWEKLVLTVPMRNGNSYFLLCFSHVFRFLPYLWGMETIFPYITRYHFFQFLPYLWGMETYTINYFFFTFFTVLTVPMRNGNVVYAGSC